MGLLRDITTALSPLGLNLVGTTSVSDYEARVPTQYHISRQFSEAQTVVVIGNGGGEFWEHFRQYTDKRPCNLDQHEHPLDRYTVQVVKAALSPRLDQEHIGYHLIYPFQFFSGLTVSFMHLAEAAGLARPSILGVQLHPTYGPWLALRASVLLDREYSDSGEKAPKVTDDFDPCPSCVERSCVTACPAQAITMQHGWDVPSCVQHRLRISTDCADRCHARFNCVYGREHRYSEDELEYHHRISFTAMRKHYEKQ